MSSTPHRQGSNRAPRIILLSRILATLHGQTTAPLHSLVYGPDQGVFLSPANPEVALKNVVDRTPFLHAISGAEVVSPLLLCRPHPIELADYRFGPRPHEKQNIVAVPVHRVRVTIDQPMLDRSCLADLVAVAGTTNGPALCPRTNLSSPWSLESRAYRATGWPWWAQEVAPDPRCRCCPGRAGTAGTGRSSTPHKPAAGSPTD
jgi:hypothetical protein